MSRRWAGKSWLHNFCALVFLNCPFAVGAEGSQPQYELTNGEIVAPLEMFKECAVCPEMIVMPLGQFMMGATPTESTNPFDVYGDDASGRVRDPDELNIIPHEQPRHEVTIDTSFAIGVNEVTFEEWDRCVEQGGCSYIAERRFLKPEGYIELSASHPLVGVSYDDFQQYIAWLNQEIDSELVYRLPTEAEWEYAARAGTFTRFPQGEELSPDQANFSRAATENVRQRQNPNGMPELTNRWQPVRVQSLDAENAWGLRHMSGNAWEITLSCWTDRHQEIPRSSMHLQQGLTTDECRRVAKGGSYGSAMDSLRPASRMRIRQKRKRQKMGFRLARNL